MPAAGYSGTPLAKKLGIVAGSRLALLDGPADYAALLGELPADMRISTAIGADTSLVHLFASERRLLAAQLQRLRAELPDRLPVWVSWPKKASGRPTDISEDGIRELALPLGYVDIKVCAVDAVWSGLKLVVRKELRSGR